MLSSVLYTLEKYWFLAASTFLIVHLARNYFHHSLNKYPGPFLANFTNLWRFFDVWGRRADITHRKLHQRYGEVVRLGPNILSFSNPRAIKTIYGRAKGFTKVSLHFGVIISNLMLFNLFQDAFLCRPTILQRGCFTSNTFLNHRRNVPRAAASLCQSCFLYEFP